MSQALCLPLVLGDHVAFRSRCVCARTCAYLCAHVRMVMGVEGDGGRNRSVESSGIGAVFRGQWTRRGGTE